VHMFGTYMGGWPIDRFGARRVLFIATFLRGVALAGLPISMACGFLTLWWAMGCYTLEALIRGFVDAAVHTVPLELAKHRSEYLDRINSRYEFTFESGAVVGLLIFSVVAKEIPELKIVPHIIIPLGFVLSATAYYFIPHSKRESFEPGPGHMIKHLAHGGTWAGIKYVFKNHPLLIMCVGLMSFNIYPLRKLLSAFFAKGLLHKSALTYQIGTAFALGGLVGALIYGQAKHRDSGFKWVALGAVGTFVLAVGWMPVNLWIFFAAVFVFGATNVCARLTLTRKRQEMTPLEHAGGVTSASQFGVNAVSVGAKSLLGAAFHSGGGAYAAFGLVGCILGLLGLGQLVLAKYIPRIGKEVRKAA